MILVALKKLFLVIEEIQYSSIMLFERIICEKSFLFFRKPLCKARFYLSVDNP